MDRKTASAAEMFIESLDAAFRVIKIGGNSRGTFHFGYACRAPDIALRPGQDALDRALSEIDKLR